jgi:type II secretion system protein N
MKLPIDIDALMARRGVRIGAYVAFFVFCFLLFAYWSFPYDRLRDHIVRQVETSSGPGGPQASGWELDIVDLSPSWGTGVTLTGVHLSKLPEGRDDKPASIVVDELTLRVSPFAYLFGSTAVSFHADLGGGALQGAYHESEERIRLEADAANLNLRRLPFFRAMLGIPLTGTLDGSLKFTVAQEAEDTDGEADLTIQGLTVGDGKAKLRVEGMQDGLTIERIAAGDLHLRAEAEDGVARVTKLEASGEDAELRGTGTVRLLLPLAMSRLDLIFGIRFSDGYRNRNDQTRALFSLMEFNPKVREARASDGTIQFRIAGPFGGRITPSPAGKVSLGAK